jgi:hypothetical protein
MGLLPGRRTRPASPSLPEEASTPSPLREGRRRRSRPRAGPSIPSTRPTGRASTTWGPRMRRQGYGVFPSPHEESPPGRRCVWGRPPGQAPGGVRRRTAIGALGGAHHEQSVVPASFAVHRGARGRPEPPHQRHQPSQHAPQFFRGREEDRLPDAAPSGTQIVYEYGEITGNVWTFDLH